MTAVRLPDWDQALAAAINAAAETDFAFGQHDCCLFIADMVKAQTGVDFGAPFRGRYRSAAGATRALRTIGGGDMADVVTEALGEPVHLAFAGYGDVVEFPEGMFGIHDRTSALVLSSDAGLVRVPLTTALRAWKVPHG